MERAAGLPPERALTNPALSHLSGLAPAGQGSVPTALPGRADVPLCASVPASASRLALWLLLGM